MKYKVVFKKKMRAFYIGIIFFMFPFNAYTFTPILLARWSQDITNSSKITPIEVWMSNDGGVLWELRGIPDSATTQGDMGIAIGVSSGKLYLTAICDNSYSFFYGARFYFSQDTGKTWERRGNIASTGIYDRNSAGMVVINDTLIYVYLLGANSLSQIEVYKSVNGGYNWSILSTIPVPTVDNDIEGDMCYGCRNKFYITEWCNDHSFPFCYSSANGISWNPIDTISLDSNTIEGRSTGIACVGDSLYATVWSNACELKLYKSTTHGTSWNFLNTILNVPSFRDGAQSIGIAKDMSFYVAAWDNNRNTSIFRSDNMGNTWTSVGSIPPVSNLWACTLSFSPLEIPPLGCAEHISVDVSDAYLVKNKDNYIFHYHLPDAEFVDLSIYDIAGKLLTRLISEVQGKGEHQKKWICNVTSGIYIYRIKLGKDTKVGKLIILK
jgi:hypothetical protein